MIGGFVGEQLTVSERSVILEHVHRTTVRKYARLEFIFLMLKKNIF